MDRADEGDETRQLALDLGMNPVVPPKSNRLIPWDYDKTLEKLDVMLTGFIHFVLIAEALR